MGEIVLISSSEGHLRRKSRNFLIKISEKSFLLKFCKIHVLLTTTLNPISFFLFLFRLFCEKWRVVDCTYIRRENNDIFEGLRKEETE